MNFKGLGGRGIDQSVQESIARTQLEAVNKSGRAKAEAKKRQKASINERLELLKQFAIRQVVNNGKEEGVVIEHDLSLGLLVVRLSKNSMRVTWAPDHISKGHLQK